VEDAEHMPEESFIVKALFLWGGPHGSSMPPICRVEGGTTRIERSANDNSRGKAHPITTQVFPTVPYMLDITQTLSL
jgi:hypothetical protein